MSRKIVHVIGTGTIGEPLIGLLCDYKNELGIDEITFHKNTPLTTDRSKVVSLNKRGARLSSHKEKFQGFKDIGLKNFLQKILNGELDIISGNYLFLFMISFFIIFSLAMINIYLNKRTNIIK